MLVRQSGRRLGTGTAAESPNLMFIYFLERGRAALVTVAAHIRAAGRMRWGCAVFRAGTTQISFRDFARSYPNRAPNRAKFRVPGRTGFVV